MADEGMFQFATKSLTKRLSGALSRPTLFRAKTILQEDLDRLVNNGSEPDDTTKDAIYKDELSEHSDEEGYDTDLDVEGLY